VSRKIDHFIAELIADDMTDISKMKKTELKGLVRELLENNYRELTNETIVELYENNFNTVVL
jgi:hypothetical protein